MQSKRLTPSPLSNRTRRSDSAEVEKSAIETSAKAARQRDAAEAKIESLAGELAALKEAAGVDRREMGGGEGGERRSLAAADAEKPHFDPLSPRREALRREAERDKADLECSVAASEAEVTRLSDDNAGLRSRVDGALADAEAALATVRAEAARRRAASGSRGKGRA